MIRFEVAGIAVPQARHRTTKTGHTYTPKKSSDYRKKVRKAAQNAWGDNPPSEACAELAVTVVLPPPSSLKKAQKQAIANGERIPKTTRPDADNYLKQASDAVNGVIVKDDSQFWRVASRKVFGSRPHIEVIVTFDKEQ